MSAKTAESGNPETTETTEAPEEFDEFGMTEADIASLVAGQEDGESDETPPESDPETETGRDDDPSQETDDDDEDGASDDEPEAEELETEEEEESESEDEDETDEDEEADDEPDPEPRGVQKRIGKLTARAKEAKERADKAEARITELEAELEQAQAAPPPPAGGNLADHAPEVREITQQVAQQRSLQAELKRMLKQMDDEVSDEAELQLADGKTLKFDRTRTENLMAESEATLRQLETEQVIARRDVSRQLATEARKFTEQAHEAYPELKSKGSEEAQAVKEVLKAYPWLKSVTSHLLDIGDLIAGRKARLAKAKASKKTGKKKPALKVRPAGSKGAPKAQLPSKATRKRRRLESSQSGSAEDIAGALPDDI